MIKNILTMIFVLIAIFTTISFAAADNLMTVQLLELEDYNEDGDTSLNNVEGLVFECVDTECTELVDTNTIIDEQLSNPDGEMTLTFPAGAETEEGTPYISYYFAEGYLPHIVTYGIPGDGWERNYEDEGYEWLVVDEIQKADVCRATIDTFSVTNSVEPYMPIEVDVIANLDASVYSAFTEELDEVYKLGFDFDLSEQYVEYYSTEIRVSLTIVDGDGTTVHTDNETLNILADGSESVHFEWTPDTEGNYTAEVQTYVTDLQCETSDPQYASQSFSVIPANLTEYCYTLMDNLTLNDETGHYYVDTEYTLSFEKISNSVDIDENLAALPTDITLEVYRVLDSGEYYLVQDEIETVGANPTTTDYQTISYPWTPNSGGTHYIYVNGIANSCEYDINLDETQELLFYVYGEETDISEAPEVFTNGPYTGCFNDVIEFTAEGSNDPDGGSITFAWDLGDETTSTDSAFSHVYTDDEGDGYQEYLVTLTVTDDEGDSTTEYTYAYISDCLGESPVANASGPYEGEIDVEVQFDGSESYDPDGTIETYVWDFGDGLGSSEEENPVYTYTAEGNYTVTLTVMDNDGNTDTDSTYADITEPANNDPVADPNGPYEGEVDEEITFDGTGSYDPDGDNLVWYFWDFGDGSNVEAGETEANPTHSYNAEGNYTVSLTVYDEKLATNTAYTYAVIVEGEDPIENNAPVAEANGNYSGTVGEEIQLSSDGSYDPDGDDLTYLWDFGDGETSEEENPTHTYDEVKQYLVTLTVTDPYGEEDSDYAYVDIESADSLNVEISADPINGVAPLEVELCSEVTGGAEPYNYEWDLGNGETSSEEDCFTYTFENIGVYPVELTVTDDQGNEASDSVDINVQEDIGVTAVLTATPSRGEPALWVRLDASESTGNDPLFFKWDFDCNGVIEEESYESNPLQVYKEEGTYTACVTVVDINGDEDTASVTITVEEEIENNGRDQLFVDTISFRGDSDYIDAGETLEIYVSATNIGLDDHDGVQVSATIQELGIYGVSGQYDMDNGEEVPVIVELDIPEWAEAGIYSVRIVISDDTTKRIKHREVIVQ